MKEQVASLGPGYQAALALSFLSDSDDKPERDVEKEPGIAEQWLAQTATRPSVMAQFTDLSIKSPFAEPQQPQMLADGGEVKEPGLLSVPTYSRTVSYEMYPGQEGQFDQRDAARHMLASGTLARKYGPTAAEMMGKMHEIGTSPLKFLGSKLGISEMPVDYEQDLHNNRIGIELARRSKSQKDLEDLVQQMAEQARGQRTEGKPWTGRPVRRADGGSAEPTPEEIAAASRPATVNPNIQRQGEAARRLAAMRDVNTLPDPRTYAAVSGFLGQAPDEMGFSALHPDREGIKRAGQAGFGIGTALQVAPIVGGAMKLANIGPSSGGRTTAAQQLGAVRTRGTPLMMGYGNTRGPDGALPSMNQAEQYVKNEIAITGDPKLNDWLSNRVTSYLRRDFATPDDQFVKAADANQLLHFVNKPTKRVDLDPYYERIENMSVDVGSLPYVRKTQGFNPQGEATTAYGKRVEDLTDASAWPVELQDITSPGLIPPSMRNMVETNPSARLTELGTNIDETLQLDQLAIDMDKMRRMPKTYSVYSQPPVKVPEEYMLTDEALTGLTLAQASNRVAKFKNWEEQTRLNMASRALFEDPSISRTPAGDKSVWVNPADLQENPAMLKLVTDVGCDGGWCTKGETYALSYGSGENRLSILMDSKARPQAQITITTKQYTPDEFIASMADDEVVAFRAKYPDIAAYQTDAIARTPEFRQWQSMNPDGLSITEIKGVNNQTDLTDAPYLKQVQQRVKDLDSMNGLQSVENLDGINMTDLTSRLYGHPSIANRPRVTKEDMKSILDEAARLNGGSRYIENEKNKIDPLFQQAADNILGPEKRATGGMVERRSDDRKYL